MYITITQSEYRKYSKEFKKTFLGKSRYRDYLWCSILGTYFTLILSLEFIIGIIKQVDVKGVSHVTGGGFYENLYLRRSQHTDQSKVSRLR